MALQRARRANSSRTLHKLIDESPRYFALDDLGGVLWLAKDKQLTQLRLNQSDQPPLQISLPDNAIGLTLDPRTGVLWVATEKKLLLLRSRRHGGDHGRSGCRQSQERRENRIRPVTQSLWVATEKSLARFSAQGVFVTSLPNKDGDGALAVPGFVLTPTLALVRPGGPLTNNPMPTIGYAFGAQCNGQPCGFASAYFSHYSLAAKANQVAIGPFVFDPNTGQTSYTPTSRLPEGLNTLTAQATDGFGHLSNTTNDSFAIDTIAPRFSSLSPAEGSLTNVPAASIQGVVDDVTATVILSGVGTATNTTTTNGTLNFSFPVTLKEGFNTFNLIAWDKANNSGTAVLHLTLDATPPRFLNVTPSDGSQLTAAQVTISGSVDDPTATVSLADLAQWNGVGANPAGQNFSWTLTLKPGANIFRISAIDQAGNAAVLNLTLTFTPPPPAAPIASNITVGTLSNGAVTLTRAAPAPSERDCRLPSPMAVRSKP